MLVLLPFDELDAVIDQIGIEVLDLLLREVDLFEALDDLVVGEDTFVETSWTSLWSSSISGSEMSTVST